MTFNRRAWAISSGNFGAVAGSIFSPSWALSEPRNSRVPSPKLPRTTLASFASIIPSNVYLPPPISTLNVTVLPSTFRSEVLTPALITASRTERESLSSFFSTLTSARGDSVAPRFWLNRQLPSGKASAAKAAGTHRTMAARAIRSRVMSCSRWE